MEISFDEPSSPPRAARPTAVGTQVFESGRAGESAGAFGYRGHASHAVTRPAQPGRREAARCGERGVVRAAGAGGRVDRSRTAALGSEDVRQRSAVGAEPGRGAYAAGARQRRGASDRSRGVRGRRGLGRGRRHGAGGDAGHESRARFAEAARRHRGVERKPYEHGRSSQVTATVPSVSTPVVKSTPHADTAPVYAKQQAKIAVLGASGYSGQEFTRLALAHPGLEIVALCSREHAGRPAAELLPGLDPRQHTLPNVLEPMQVVPLLENGACDTIVACLPHGAWKQLVAETPALGSLPARVVDLSSDHRDGSAGYVYGLPEAFRDDIPGATRAANPGC